MVAFLVWDQAVAGSSPVTSTLKRIPLIHNELAGFFNVMDDVISKLVSSWFEALLPYGLDTIAEVVDDMTSLDATASGEETANDTGDVLADVEGLRIVHTDALHTKTETADAREYHRLAFPQFLLQNILKFRYDTDDRTLREAAVTTGLFGDFTECHLALAHGLGKIFPIRTATLDIVLD